MAMRIRTAVETVLRALTSSRPAGQPARGLADRRAVTEELENRRLLSASTRIRLSDGLSTLSYSKGKIVDSLSSRYVKTVAPKKTTAYAGKTSNLSSVLQAGFQINVVFPDSSLTTSQKAAFTTAAARWQSIILGDLPDVTGTFGGPSETIDDVKITATGPNLDGPGGTLGQAGPEYLRPTTNLPIKGFMEFDSADLAAMESSGTLVDVITHEMGHVLGLGTLWDPAFDNLITGAGGSDPRYTGSSAITQYKAIFGVNTATIPVENTGGPGTADGHWRESGGAGVGFGNELMTGYISGTNNPISRVTIAQYADLGYSSVNLNGFDVYTPPDGGNAYPTIGTLTTSASPAPAGTTLTLTANTVADSNGTVSNVRFYRETNGIPGLQVLTGAIGDVSGDTLLGTDSSSAGGWTINTSTSSLANGTYTYYAQATDNQALVSVNVTTTHTVGAAVTSAVPGTPDLLAASDTGAFSTDNVTNRDNSSGTKTLQFDVPGTISGATVSLYSSGTLIGSAVAAGTTTTITTNGAFDLVDGLRSITARQTESGKTQSADSPSLTLSIDTVGPILSGATFSYLTNKPRVTFNGNEQIYTFTAGSVTVNKTSPAPTGATAFVGTGVSGGYQLDFPASPNGILANGRYTATAATGSLFDLAGNASANSATLNFFVLAGDANRDTTVDFNDFLVLQNHFNTAGNFADGDFDYNGLIDFNDFLILQNNFGVTV